MKEVFISKACRFPRKILPSLPRRVDCCMHPSFQAFQAIQAFQAFQTVISRIFWLSFFFEELCRFPQKLSPPETLATCSHPFSQVKAIIVVATWCSVGGGLRHLFGWRIKSLLKQGNAQNRKIYNQTEFDSSRSIRRCGFTCDRSKVKITTASLVALEIFNGVSFAKVDVKEKKNAESVCRLDCDLRYPSQYLSNGHSIFRRTLHESKFEHLCFARHIPTSSFDLYSSSLEAPSLLCERESE